MNHLVIYQLLTEVSRLPSTVFAAELTQFSVLLNPLVDLRAFDTISVRSEPPARVVFSLQFILHLIHHLSKLLHSYLVLATRLRIGRILTTALGRVRALLVNVHIKEWHDLVCTIMLFDELEDLLLDERKPSKLKDTGSLLMLLVENGSYQDL